MRGISNWHLAALVALLGLTSPGNAQQFIAPEAASAAAIPPTPPPPALRRCGILCWAHHNGYSCSSLKSETVFLFGSCRAFFGEPCLKGPPPPPFPVYANPNAPTGRCKSCP